MTADIFPEDSVLRRHAATERMRLLGQPPTDSVLRRHYEQLQQVSAVPAPAPAPTRPAPALKLAQPAPSPAPAAAREQPAEHGGGLLGWLKRLLAG